MSNEINVGAISEALNNKVDLNQLNTNEQGLEYVSGLSMPSSRYIDLTLGSSGTQYIAPANGYYNTYWTASSNNQYLTLENITNQFATTSFSVANYNTVRCWLPVKKGDVVQTGYSVGTLNYIRFYYAEGESEE